MINSFFPRIADVLSFAKLEIIEERVDAQPRCVFQLFQSIRPNVPEAIPGSTSISVGW